MARTRSVRPPRVSTVHEDSAGPERSPTVRRGAVRQLIESADADAESMEAAEPAPEDAAAVVGPAGWHAPQIPAGATVLSESPIAYTLDNMLSDEECDHVIKAATPLMKRALVSGDAKGEVSNVRTNSVGWLAAAGDRTLETIEDRICGLFACEPECTENFQVIHYDVDQEYKAHLDAYDLNTARGQRTTAKGGQRLITVLVYLSDVEEGGSTGFPTLGVEAMPAKGRVLVFYDCEPGSLKPDARKLHCGSPVIAGTKWAANKWIRQYPMRCAPPRRFERVHLLGRNAHRPLSAPQRTAAEGCRR